jgi:hypothetical protein
MKGGTPITTSIPDLLQELSLSYNLPSSLAITLRESYL